MIDILVDTVIEEINFYLKKEGIDRREFANRVGVKYHSLNNMLSKLNKKESFITMTTLKKIEKVLKSTNQY